MQNLDEIRSHTFHLVSLGCAKNQVDSEVIIGNLSGAGWKFTEDPQEADVLLLNTCGFVQPAVEEAIEEILELAQYKEARPECKLVVAGCLVQRYGDSLLAELPEVDLFVGTEGCHTMAQRVAALFANKKQPEVQLPPRFLMDSSTPRTLTTPSFRAWFKITEGCDNRCSYCMIPSIRGGLRSRSTDDLVREAIRLEGMGVRELSVIGQDITAYGTDLGRDTDLVSLLSRLLAETAIPWIRLLYLYPTGIDERLLELMAANKRIVPYLDIPLQHVSSRVLKSMNRRYGYDDMHRLINTVRGYLPEVALRTTLLVGFPGELEEDIDQVQQFLTEARLDHVGVFPYANEEGSPSERYPDQCSEQEKMARRERILELQAGISSQIQQKYVGREEQVLVEGVSRETDLLLEGRTRFQAPDVDGCVYINDGIATAGQFVTVRITESQVYDLIGGIV